MTRLPTVPLRPSLGPVYLVQGICSAAAHFVGVSIFFYMEHTFGWGALENLTFASFRGVVFVAGALLSHSIARRVGRRSMVIGLQAVLAGIMLLTAAAPAWGAIPVAVLGCLYSIGGALLWPALESLVASAPDARALGRQLGIYNMVWPAAGAAAVAVSGAIIEHWPTGLFVISAAGHIAAMGVAWWYKRATDGLPPAPTGAAPHAEPALLRMRIVALRLSRVALPATYIVTYALASLLPSLPVLQHLDPTARTVLGSVWLVGRFLAFALLAATAFWHTRPRLLLAATLLMLVAFLGITIRPSELGWSTSWATDAAVMIVSQLAVGLAIGLIYSASLYFGMVLSRGSTEHGGYHEALIGLGSTIGPLSGAIVQWARPGDVRLSVLAVAGVLGLTVAATAAVAVRARVREETDG